MSLGARYKKRVDATVGGFIVLNAGVTCIMVAGLLDCTASLLFILQCGFSFLILTALIGGVLLLVGRSAHQLRFADALALVLEEYAVAKVAAQDSNYVEQRSRIIDELAAAHKLLVLNADVNPVTVLGIEITENIVRGLGTVR